MYFIKAWQFYAISKKWTYSHRHTCSIHVNYLKTESLRLDSKLASLQMHTYLGTPVRCTSSKRSVVKVMKFLREWKVRKDRHCNYNNVCLVFSSCLDLNNVLKYQQSTVLPMLTAPALLLIPREPLFFLW